jgi:hypothetical protein
VSETPAERDQELRFIARRISELQARRELVYEHWGANVPADASIEIARIDTELTELRARRMELQEQLPPETIKEQVKQMWTMLDDALQLLKAFQKQLDDLRQQQRRLETRQDGWFERDAADRAWGYMVANVWRVLVLVGLVAVIYLVAR